MTPRTAGPSFLAIVGPTASGKTRLSLEVAGHLDLEVVSMDSRQVYRGMDVGTAKVSLLERTAVPHHGLDLRDPDERYSAGDFGRDARRWIEDIGARGRVPLVVGGTGFFLRALTDPLFEEPPMDPRRKEALGRALGALPREELERWARVLDPSRAALAAQGGRQRLVRTVSVAVQTGRPLSWWHREKEPEAEALCGVVLLLHIPRDELDRRIAGRVDTMMRSGFVEEVARLKEAGYGATDPGFSGTGYRHVLDYLENAVTLDTAAEGTRLATRQYARRQRTWFRRQLAAGVETVDATLPVASQASAVVAAWARANQRREGRA